MERVSRDFKFTPFETSAVSGKNVDTAFGCLFYKILEPCLDNYNKIQKLLLLDESQQNLKRIKDLIETADFNGLALSGQNKNLLIKLTEELLNKRS